MYEYTDMCISFSYFFTVRYVQLLRASIRLPLQQSFYFGVTRCSLGCYVIVYQFVVGELLIYIFTLYPFKY